MPLHRSLLRLAALAACVLFVGCAAGTLPAVHSESERLDAARRALAKGDGNVAAELLKTYIANNAGSRDVDEAIELLGQAYLMEKDWTLAVEQFDRLLRDYPESDSSAAAAFHLGEAYDGQARPPDFDQEFTRKALDQWLSYRRDYPGHWLQPEADRKIARARTRLATKLLHTGELYLKLRQYGPARMYFGRVVVEYGDTPLACDARLGTALADAHRGKRDQALADLQALEGESACPGTKLRAERERARLLKTH